jgi:hypothetical protein
MKNEEKLQLMINEIKSLYPNRIILNGTQTAKVLGISTRTFSRFINSKEWHKLPKFKSEEIQRNGGVKNNKYQFNIFDVAEFLATN